MTLRPSVLITPSILSANFGFLQSEIESIEPYADWLQIDVMDGHFVRNMSIGAPVLSCIRTSLPIDVHLMVSNPADRIDEFLALKVKNITFHAEAVPNTADRLSLIERIHAGGAIAGIALNPESPISSVDDCSGIVDLFLVMTVHPGAGGQAFIPSCLEKVRVLRERHPEAMIQVDGGITPETARLARAAGANNLVAGSAIFRSQNRKESIAALRA